MYFYVTLIIGLLVLYKEITSLKDMFAWLRTSHLKTKWVVVAFCLVSGIVVGFLMAVAEYKSPFSDQPTLTYYSAPIQAGATDGIKDFFGIFTLPAIFLNFIIGFLLPVLFASLVLKIVNKIGSAKGG